MSADPLDTKREVADKRAGLILAIRTRATREAQLKHADAYIASIQAHSKATGRKFPVPNRYAIIRSLG